MVKFPKWEIYHLRSYKRKFSVPFEVLFVQIEDETVPFNELFASDLPNIMIEEKINFYNLID